jgi:hypothetical protein
MVRGFSCLQALVDGNAFVTFNYVYNFMQPPVEPPDELDANDSPKPEGGKPEGGKGRKRGINDCENRMK